MPFLTVGAWNFFVTLYLSPGTVHTGMRLALRHGCPTRYTRGRRDVILMIDMEGQDNQSREQASAEEAKAR